MVQRFVSVVFLIGLALSNSGTFAQTDPGVPIRGLQVRIITDSSRDKVVRFEYNGPAAYVRIERIEAGAKRNDFPYTIDAARLRAALLAVHVPSDKNSALFIESELDEIVPPLSRALAQATGDQDVCFAVSGRHGSFGPLSPRLVTTGRVFRVDGHLNIVFGMIRHDWEDQFKASGTLIPFEPGRRAGPLRDEPTVSVDPAYGEIRRGDWLVLSDTPPPPAVATPAPAPATPATAAPAPQAPPAATAPEQGTPAARPNYDAVAQRLRTLQKLRDDGLITQQEYEEKRREILKDL